MALTDYVIMPGADYQAACDAVREKTGKTDLLKSGDLAAAIKSITDFDASDEMLKYFVCNIDSEKKTITLYSILYDVLYENTGSYDIVVPDIIGNYNVIIKCE